MAPLRAFWKHTYTSMKSQPCTDPQNIQIVNTIVLLAAVVIGHVNKATVVSIASGIFIYRKSHRIDILLI